MSMPGPLEWAIIIGVIILIFGVGKLSRLGKDVGEGIRNFRNALKGEKKERPDQQNEKSDSNNKPIG